jgi:hypothetical protein
MHVCSAEKSHILECGHHIENDVIEARTIVDPEIFAHPTTQERYQILIDFDVSQNKAAIEVERSPWMSHGTAGEGYVKVV